MNSTVKTLIFWIVIVFAAVALWQLVKGSSTAQRTPEISYSQFLSQVDAGNIVRVRIAKVRVDGVYRDGSVFRAIAPASQEQMLQVLRQKSVEIWYADSSEESGWGWLVNLFAPLLLLAALWFFMIRQMKTAANVQRARASANSEVMR